MSILTHGHNSEGQSLLKGDTGKTGRLAYWKPSRKKIYLDNRGADGGSYSAGTGEESLRTAAKERRRHEDEEGLDPLPPEDYGPFATEGKSQDTFDTDVAQQTSPLNAPYTKHESNDVLVKR